MILFCNTCKWVTLFLNITWFLISLWVKVQHANCQVICILSVCIWFPNISYFIFILLSSFTFKEHLWSFIHLKNVIFCVCCLVMYFIQFNITIINIIYNNNNCDQWIILYEKYSTLYIIICLCFQCSTVWLAD